MAVQRLRHFLLGYIQMFGKKTIAEGRDACFHFRIARSLDGQIAFSVESQAAIAQIRRADAHIGIIDDTDFAVYADAAFFRVGHTRIIKRETVIAIDGPKPLEHPPPQNIHRMLLQPPIAAGMQNHDDIRSILPL